MNLISRITTYLKKASDLKLEIIKENATALEHSIRMIIDVLNKGGKILVFGNGGSAAQASHLATELVVKLNFERAAFPALALTTDTGIISACSNDFKFDMVFSRQVDALANEKDVLIGITTSGDSENVVRALAKGGEIGCKRICLTGSKPGKVDGVSDIVIKVPSESTQLIQEGHLSIIHIFCESLELAYLERLNMERNLT